MKTLTMAIFSAFAIALVLPVTSAFAATPGFSNLYYNGTIVRTVVPPAAFPNEGKDNFYKVTNGATVQLGIAAVAPGSSDYHGSHCNLRLGSHTRTTDLGTGSSLGPERWDGHCDPKCCCRLSLPGSTIASS